MPTDMLHFPPFTLDIANGCLWRGKKRLSLMPKDCAVLHYLATHAGQIVQHEELLRAVWPDTVVSVGVLKVCIRRLRYTLHDNATIPRFIETVHRRGYRFLPTVTTSPVASSQYSAASSSSSPPTPPIVGRESELAQLHGWLAQALTGDRQLVFVTGEPGIGKTTLVDAFLAGLGQPAAGNGQPSAAGHDPGYLFPNAPSLLPPLWIGRGQCIEAHGAGEPFLPILDAVAQVCAGPQGAQLIDLLRRSAPMWLVQLPALVDAAEFKRIQRQVQGASRERMLREFAHAVEAITAVQPFLLCLEDLHWSDGSTLDLLAFLARRTAPARLFVFATYRPVEMLSTGHPLKQVVQELMAHRLCVEVAVERLSEADIVAYLQARFRSGAEQAALWQQIAQRLYRRTGGNPLFLVSLVNDLLERGVFGQTESGWTLPHELDAVDRGVPESIRQLVARQRERVAPPDRRVLEAASVAGLEFSAAAVAAALERDVVEVEEQCAELAERQQFVRPAGIAEWPDGTVAARYVFVHALYQELWHELVSVNKLQRFHRHIGERKEAAYGKRAGEIAAELALHFEQARDYGKAVRYLRRAGENAIQRNAHQEAALLLRKGLALLKRLPDTPERIQHELALHIPLGSALMVTKGYAAQEVGAVCTRALALTRQVEETPQLFLAVSQLWVYYVERAELHQARALGEHLLTLAHRLQSPQLVLVAHSALGMALFWLGELTLAGTHLEQVIAGHNPEQYKSSNILQDLGAACLTYAALVLWQLGYPDQALQRSHEAVQLGQNLSRPYELLQPLIYGAVVHQWRREGRTAQERTEAGMVLSNDHGFPFWSAWGTVLRGWALAEQGQLKEGIAQLHQGVAAHWRTGAELARPYFLVLLAEAYEKAGQSAEGLAVVAEALALVNHTEERVYEAELYRLKGKLTLEKFQVPGSKFQVTNPQPLTLNPQTEAEVEACFLKAIEIAQKQQAKSLELRAVMSLSRLWRKQGKAAEARRVLADIYHWFTEGFDTKDLQEAKALLEAVDH